MIAAVSSGHVDLSDWLLLAAFVVFVVDVVLALIADRVPGRNDVLLPAGVALLALAWMVL